jgi:aminoglycoside phosphotransferase (APT) family kinase protein
MAAWERTLAVSGWVGSSVWTHADLLPDNLLADGGRLTAVIDFECYGAGEPALDLTPAWFIFSKRQRAVFRALVDVDTATWERGRNHALRAVMGIRYYETTNPGFSAMCLRAVTEAISGD